MKGLYYRDIQFYETSKGMKINVTSFQTWSQFANSWVPRLESLMRFSADFIMLFRLLSNVLLFQDWWRRAKKKQGKTPMLPKNGGLKFKGLTFRFLVIRAISPDWFSDTEKEKNTHKFWRDGSFNLNLKQNDRQKRGNTGLHDAEICKITVATRLKSFKPQYLLFNRERCILYRIFGGI